MIWRWWMTLLVIFAVLFLIGCIPVGVDARYSPDGVFLAAKIGPILLQFLPAKPKKAKKSKKKSASAKPAAPKKAPDAQKRLSLPGGADGILRIARLAADTLGDLRRKLRVDELMLHVVFGSDDPARAAMGYGRAWAVIGALTPAIDRLFVIKKRDICPILDYTIDKMIVDAHLVLTITIGRALALGLKAGAGFLKLLNDSKKGGVQT